MTTKINRIDHATGTMAHLCEFTNRYSPVHNLATLWCKKMRLDADKAENRQRAMSNITIVKNRTAFFDHEGGTFVTSNTSPEGVYEGINDKWLNIKKQ